MTERDADGHARFDALVTHYPSSTHVAARPSIRPLSLLEFLFSLFPSPADNTHVGDGGSGDPLRQPASRRGMSCTYCMHVCAVPGHPLYFCRLPSRFPFLVKTFAFFFLWTRFFSFAFLLSRSGKRFDGSRRHRPGGGFDHLSHLTFLAGSQSLSHHQRTICVSSRPNRLDERP